MTNPLNQLMADRKISDDVMAAMVDKDHRPTPESIRHIRQGHRRPSWELSFALERALEVSGLAHQLRDWTHYPYAPNRPRRKRAA